VTSDEGARFADDRGLIFVETSAKTGERVEEAFVAAARAVSDKIATGAIDAAAKFSGVKVGHGVAPFGVEDPPPPRGARRTCCQ